MGIFSFWEDIPLFCRCSVYCDCRCGIIERIPHGLEKATHFLLWESNFCKCEYYNRSMEEKRRMVEMGWIPSEEEYNPGIAKEVNH